MTHADPRERLNDLVSRYGRLISSAVARVGGREVMESREDIEQEVLLSLWKQVEREQEIEHPSSYLYRAAVRETVRLLRRQAARREEPLDDEGVPPRGAAPESPEVQVASAEVAAAVEGALSRLASPRRLAVRAHLAGYEVAEIMQMQGWPYQKARNLISRGMADLRRELRQAGIDG